MEKLTTKWKQCQRGNRYCMYAERCNACVKSETCKERRGSHRYCFECRKEAKTEMNCKVNL
jgi:hypothetical protein